jgi:hypothetical protein
MSEPLVDLSKRGGFSLGTVAAIVGGALVLVSPGIVGLHRVTTLEAQNAAQAASATAKAEALEKRIEKAEDSSEGRTRELERTMTSTRAEHERRIAVTESAVARIEGTLGRIEDKIDRVFRDRPAATSRR